MSKEKKPWMRVKEFAELSGIDSQTIRKALRKGELHGFKVGHQWLISVEQFEQGGENHGA